MYKKILISIFSLILFQSICQAQPVSFVYINGSNNNDEKMQNWFLKGVNKLHPVLKKKFEQNKQIKEVFLNQDLGYTINSEPSIFFWGDKSQRNLEFVHKQLDISKALSPTIAYQVRSLLTSFLHDAIWVQKQHNMLPILDELNEKIKQEKLNGNNVVLFGYSAGSFITYEYMFNKLPYINVEDLFNSLNVSDEFKKFVKENPQRPTCISALSKAEIGAVMQSGKLVFQPSEDILKKNYLNLNSATEQVCAPDNTLMGVVNFASPLVLFYSDLADPEYDLTYYNKLMLKYIIEQGLFFITVNYREDPMGFPATKNLTIDEMKKITQVDFNNPKGFIYDNSSVWSKRSFLFAHTSYWSSRKTFSNAVVKAFVNGYRLQYDKEFQEKVLKNRKSKIKYEM